MDITNWDKWQTFRKDRGAPPWIKVHRNLLTNEEWVSLSDQEKGQLVSIWLLAADKNGTIPENPKTIMRMAMLESEPNINKFIELGFMASTCQPHDNHMTTIKEMVDANMTHQSRVEEIIVEESRSEGKTQKRFIPPSLSEVSDHILVKGYLFDAEAFIAHYESNGWLVGRNKMKSWKSACITWSKRGQGNGTGKVFNQQSANKPRSPGDRVRAAIAQQERDEQAMGADG